MAGNVSVIDPKEVHIVVGTHRVQGFARGQYFNAEKINDDVSFEEGTDGEQVFVESTSEGWTITITLLQSSRSNDKLWAIRQAARNAPGGAPVPLAVTHRGTKMVSAAVRIQKPPAVSFADGVETRVWTMLAANFEGTIQGLTSP
jgi:hypothetical protein